MKNKVINDLYDYGYKIVQDKDYFKFSLDSILLADFINVELTDKKMLDLCTGNAPVPIILSKNKKLKIFGIELQKEIYDMGIESLKLNKIDNVELILDNVKNAKNYFPGNNFDIISCNPPYFKCDDKSIVNDNMIKTIARHEKEINLEEIVQTSAYLLNNKGKFYIVHRTERMIELIGILHKYNLGIKKMAFAYDNEMSDASMFLIEAKKNAKDDVKVLKPIMTKNYRGEKR